MARFASEGSVVLVLLPLFMVALVTDVISAMINRPVLLLTELGTPIARFAGIAIAYEAAARQRCIIDQACELVNCDRNTVKLYAGHRKKRQFKTHVLSLSLLCYAKTTSQTTSLQSTSVRIVTKLCIPFA